MRRGFVIAVLALVVGGLLGSGAGRVMSTSEAVQAPLPEEIRHPTCEQFLALREESERLLGEWRTTYERVEARRQAEGGQSSGFPAEGMLGYHESDIDDMVRPLAVEAEVEVLRVDCFEYPCVLIGRGSESAFGVLLAKVRQLEPYSDGELMDGAGEFMDGDDGAPVDERATLELAQHGEIGAILFLRADGPKLPRVDKRVAALARLLAERSPR